MNQTRMPEGRKEALKPSSFRERLALAMKTASISPPELASRLGVTPQAIYKYEHTDALPASDNLFRLADELRVSARWLITGIDDGLAAAPREDAEKNPAWAQALSCLLAYQAGGFSDQNLVTAAIALLQRQTDSSGK